MEHNLRGWGLRQGDVFYEQQLEAYKRINQLYKEPLTTELLLMIDEFISRRVKVERLNRADENQARARYLRSLQKDLALKYIDKLIRELLCAKRMVR